MERVVVGMSGGVDSSVAAYLLKEAGYEVIGVTMQIWQQEDMFSKEENGGCCGLSAVEDARRVAEKLEIPHYVMNFRTEFQSKVIDYFATEYYAGRTPNPCIACNRFVKWESLLERSLSIGADFIATGHYARIQKLPNQRYTLQTSITAKKDQTYALYNLTQEQLKRTKMPVGDYTKEEIREIAKKLELPVAKKPDSQEICFVPDHDYASFLESYTKKKAEAGNFVDQNNKVLGKHKGVIHYTVGQRKGLGLALGYPTFVVELRPDTKEVVLGTNEELFERHLICNNLNHMAVETFLPGQEFLAKIRYNHSGAPCKILEVGNDWLRLEFLEPQRAITPGQAVVFYEGDYVAGGGTILSPKKG